MMCGCLFSYLAKDSACVIMHDYDGATKNKHNKNQHFKADI